MSGALRSLCSLVYRAPGEAKVTSWPTASGTCSRPFTTDCRQFYFHGTLRQAAAPVLSVVSQAPIALRLSSRQAPFTPLRSSSMKRRVGSTAATAAGPAGSHSSDTTSAEVVICGGGIVGAAIAYFLTKRGVKPIVIERTAVAAAASGKAGGFLARGWGDGSPTQQLHHASFDLHAKLAQELGVESYRRIPTLSVAGGRRKGGGGTPASWLDGDVSRASMMDPNTAQVIPFELTNKLMDAAVAAGATLRIGAVTGVETTDGDDGGRCMAGVRVRNEDGAESIIRTDQVVVAMGPWSVLAEDWLEEAYAASPTLPRLRLPIEGVKSTSIVYHSEDLKAKVAAEPYALFCAEDRNGCHLEVYPRYNGEVYICGCGGSDYVSGSRLREGGDCEHQGLVHADRARVKAASTSFAGLTTLARDDSGSPAAPDISQACMRPCASDAMPIIGEVPGVKGMYLATAHNCWGILWSPITGLAMSELLVDGRASSVDLSHFSPSRFMESRRVGTRGRHAGQTAVGEQW